MAGSRKLGKATAEKTRMEVTSLKRLFWILSALPGMTIPTLLNVVLQLWSGGGVHVRRLLRKQAGLSSASLIVVRASVSLRPSPYLAPSGLSVRRDVPPQHRIGGCWPFFYHSESPRSILARRSRFTRPRRRSRPRSRSSRARICLPPRLPSPTASRQSRKYILRVQSERPTHKDGLLESSVATLVRMDWRKSRSLCSRFASTGVPSNMQVRIPASIVADQ
jgi:hypothetical protein